MLPSERFYPMAEIERFDNILDNLFGRFFSDFFSVRVGENKKRFVPAIDFIDREDHFLLRASLSGVKKEDINISLDDGILSLKGELKRENEEKKDDCCLSERCYGAFNRAIRLPSEINEEKVEAVLKDGFLDIKLPKKKSPKKRRSVKIKHHKLHVA